MKFMKPLKTAAVALAMLFVVGVATPVSAATYKDVPTSHWGYTAINRVTDLGFMSGDLSGNFNPNGYIDKFETTKILAKMAGYKYTGATTAEADYYNACLAKHIGFINLYANKFTMWNATTNKEIAFLLEKGVLVNDDLNQFVVIVNGKESLRALSREEAAVFFVRLISPGITLSNTTTNPFKDDASISAAAKPYVYHLRSLGVVSGDTNNNFSPKGAVVKAAMASMISSVWNIMNPTAPTTPTPSTPAPGANYTTVSGKVGKLYADFRALQVASSDANNNKIFPVTTTATITIDGAAKTFTDLREGMNFTGVTLNGELISIAATSGGAVPTAAPEVPTTPVTSIVEGTVTAAQATSVNIEVRMLTPRGEIYTEVRTFAIPSNCVITRGGKTTTATAITKGDIAKATITNGVLTKLELQEKDRKFEGEIIAKRLNTTTAGSTPVITVKDSDGNLNELVVTDKSVISRRGVGVTTWSNLRVGDTVEVTTEYEKILTLYASGKYSNIDGYVREIRIMANGACELTFEDTSGKTAVYPVVTGAVNPYDFRVGAKLRLHLDSKEIESFSILQDAGALGFTGVVTRLTASVIEIRDTSTNVKREFTIDSLTAIRDMSTDKAISITKIDLNSRVTISVDPNNSTRAKTISVVQY